ncbi:UbiA family prenyltransferase [Desulfonatronum thiodismutans]|uniref:UbiA family prenyltransferase n=1 Tax=Desulfonatronum thiodismutans TaxID=159290 RepID=UPI0004ABD328|nr:UbiA family prenyltransferase [Desulfonatronum thiodismutans]
MEFTNQSPTDIPLVVDLDGTLLRTDLLLESGFAFVRAHPLRALAPIAWLMRGKANLKAQLAFETPLDIASLPFAPDVVEFLKAEQARGRNIILATAGHKTYADAVAAHLGLFERVLASDGALNLSARTKRDVLVRIFGENGFDYMGNSHDDIPVWAVARQALLVNPGLGVESRVRALGNVERVMRTKPFTLKTWPKALRFHQWVKNLLIFIPLLASHQIDHPSLLAFGLLAFLCFGLCASSVYLLNDLLDLQDDRRHPTKRLRPLASGTLSLQSALFAFPVLLLLAFFLSFRLLPLEFTLVMGAYYVLTLGYSLGLKRIMAVDVIVLAMLYTLRLFAGSFVFNVPLTFWMLAFSMFLFLSLALVKRHAELRLARDQGLTCKTRGRGYYPDDLEMVSSLGAASGYLAVLVLALYIQDDATLALYTQPAMIWPACPLLLYWISRIWFVAHRGRMHDDPVVFTIKDPLSWAVGLLIAATFWFAI